MGGGRITGPGLLGLSSFAFPGPRPSFFSSPLPSCFAPVAIFLADASLCVSSSAGRLVPVLAGGADAGGSFAMSLAGGGDAGGGFALEADPETCGGGFAMSLAGWRFAFSIDFGAGFGLAGGGAEECARGGGGGRAKPESRLASGRST